MPPERDQQRLGSEVYQGVAKTSSGYKMLATMGWSEGQGLGAQKQGIKEHIKVKKKHDAMGVGGAEHTAHSHGKNWNEGMMGFDQVLSGLKEVTAVHPDSSDDSSSSDDSGSDSEDAKPVSKGTKTDKSLKGSKAPPPKKAAAKKKKKQESSSSSDSDSSDASSSSNSSDSEPEISTKKVATHTGRYQKRERGKMVKGYSAQDLAAILGAGGGGEAEEEVKGHYTSGDLGGVETSPVEESEPEEKQWWSYYFVRAGKMRSTRSELKGKHLHSHHHEKEDKDAKKKINVVGFTENDQESLYTLVQDTATHGKQGLGRSSMPKKVAGTRWSGSKLKIKEEGESSSDEEEGGETGVSGSSSSSEDEDEGKVVVMASKTEQKVLDNHSAVTAAGAGSGLDEEGGKKKSKEKKKDKKAEKEEVEKGKKEKKKGKKEEEAQVEEKEEKKEKKKGKKAVTFEEEVVQEEPPSGGEKKRKRDKTEMKEASDKAVKSDSEDTKSKKAKSGKQKGSSAVANGAEAKPIKWHKVLDQILSDAPKRRLTLEKLKKRVLEAAQAKAEREHEVEEEEEHLSRMMKKIRASPERYNVCEKFVSLKD